MKIKSRVNKAGAPAPVFYLPRQLKYQCCIKPQINRYLD